MPLEAPIATLVDQFIAAGRPSVRNQSLEQRRAGYVASTALAGATEQRVEVRDCSLAGVALRVVSPLGAVGALPTLIYLHGGCFVSGGFATHDNQLRQLAFYSGCRVIAPGYRLAPEHPWPAAHDDVQRAVTLIWQNAQQLGVDKERVTLAGDSAGGHLALVTALRLRDAGQWQARQLILIYPMLDASASLPSYQRYGEDYVITREALVSGYQAYFGDLSADHPEASPLWRPDLTGLPEVHIITAQYDPLCDEGEALFKRLRDNGVYATHRCYPGMIHGFFQLGGISPTARTAMRDIAARAALPPGAID